MPTIPEVTVPQLPELPKVTIPEIPTTSTTAPPQAPPEAEYHASSAGAPPTDENFDVLSGCEAGNNWQTNTGNTYYGGLQMNMGFWDGYGGQEFADRPDHATREQQIEIARRGYYDTAADKPGNIRGWTPWPNCSREKNLR